MYSSTYGKLKCLEKYERCTTNEAVEKDYLQAYIKSHGKRYQFSNSAFRQLNMYKEQNELQI